MSLLNDLLGGQGQQAGAGSLISVAGQLIERAGGVQGLIAMLQQHGLGDAVQWWVGTGSNQPVSGDQLGQALQKGGLGSLLQEAAGKLGVDQGQLLGQLSQVLPGGVRIAQGGLGGGIAGLPQLPALQRNPDDSGMLTPDKRSSESAGSQEARKVQRPNRAVRRRRDG